MENCSFVNSEERRPCQTPEFYEFRGAASLRSRSRHMQFEGNPGIHSFRETLKFLLNPKPALAIFPPGSVRVDGGLWGLGCRIFEPACLLEGFSWLYTGVLPQHARDWGAGCVLSSKVMSLSPKPYIAYSNPS